MQLTDDQVKNWRNLLVMSIGPYALIAPKEVIEKFVDRFQEGINSMDKGTKNLTEKKVEVPKAKGESRKQLFNTPFANLKYPKPTK